MPFDAKRSRVVFQSLNRQLGKLSKSPSSASVHKFRTYSRRVETILGELVADPNRNQKKLLKLLERWRRKAGQVRDLDVEISALGNLKVPEPAGQKAPFMRALAQERERREKKLAKSLDRESLREAKRRLKRALRDLEIPESADPMAMATRRLAELGRHSPFTEKTLHQYRIAGKRARYLAELAGHDPSAELLVAQLKRMQDQIGDWHDWWKLTERAEALFGGASDSTLVAMLRNLTRAKFRQAIGTLSEARFGLSPQTARKAPEATAGPKAAVA